MESLPTAFLCSQVRQVIITSIQKQGNLGKLNLCCHLYCYALLKLVSPSPVMSEFTQTQAPPRRHNTDRQPWERVANSPCLSLDNTKQSVHDLLSWNEMETTPYFTKYIKRKNWKIYFMLSQSSAIYSLQKSVWSIYFNVVIVM